MWGEDGESLSWEGGEVFLVAEKGGERRGWLMIYWFDTPRGKHVGVCGRRRTAACRCCGTPGWDKFCLFYAYPEKKRDRYPSTAYECFHNNTLYIQRLYSWALQSEELFDEIFSFFHVTKMLAWPTARAPSWSRIKSKLQAIKAGI